jgi:hypothetical protein
VNDNTHSPGGGPRRSPRWRAGALAATLAGTALLAAACGGGRPAAGKPAAYQLALAYARCMRSHGVPGWPDPSSSGTFDTGQIDLNSVLVNLAASACGQLPPGVHLQLSAAQQQALLKRGLKIAACMRAHGITNFPDPDVQSAKEGAISLGGGSITHNEMESPLFQAAQKACVHA